MQESNLLLEIGVPFRQEAGALWVESQAQNGLHLWAKHFDQVTVCATVVPPDFVADTTVQWANPSALLAEGRVRFETLPWAFHPRDHFKHRTDVRRRLDALVQTHRYSCFSSTGVFGAWGSVAAAAARRHRRPYSLWFDWVLHAMSTHVGGTLRTRLKRSTLTWLNRYETERAIRGCALGLFHGQTVYDAYAPLCRQPQLVHDVHVRPADAIGEEALSAKIASQSARRSLNVGYVGRCHPMKAPSQWIEAVANAARSLGEGRIHATWLGDGPLLEESRALVRALGLDATIRFPGFLSDRSELLSFLREQDVLLFSHVTPESPRCLLEAIVSGTPLVGYDSSYARELVGERGGALLSAMGDTVALGSNLVRLANDRRQLSNLTVAAASSRGLYNDEAVFAHRSRLIKRYL